MAEKGLSSPIHRKCGIATDAAAGELLREALQHDPFEGAVAGRATAAPGARAVTLAGRWRAIIALVRARALDRR